MHRSDTFSSELGFLPSLYPIPGLAHTSDMRVTRGASDHKHLTGVSVQSSSWEKRCLRKHKRRNDDDGCSPKRRKLTGQGPYLPWGNTSTEPVQVMPASPLPEPAPQYLASPSALPCTEAEGSCMEVEAAQRRLQEIEDRITLEDDEDEEDLDVDQTQNRPVLVMSDSLKEGLQQGLGDILPHTVAQSVSRSCMELVLWRPPEETLPRRLKESLHRQRKQAACRHTPTPTPTPVPANLDATLCEHEPPAMLFCNPQAQGPAEEDMEL
ncbi:coiled-coil domain-containing protein 117 isoform X2 [Paramormyrops kingsleyae]|uniref:Coiled-coil domain containing 117 n=2 Tax=Paramormyrops kingsleyae TaxID=1676925 RepID=A0A3B3QMD5_9TELE|nr:coiled-coil domain-containing protein 117 isoform X2 [Paramormyrops kingsleyae]XP_023660099.1 coiled-coil domain-containing protein 117 isoform X2 [Paramormyrops kingsleyae]XP_023660100.1 coiled-coil domain-containing protein 117 isoform X2 [Paramormyrops kingsleyae]